MMDNSEQAKSMVRGLKVCPHCGELLFSDMDVCYECLYDFRKSACEEVVRGGSERSRARGTAASVMRHDPLATIDLDEVELDEVDPDEAGPDEAVHGGESAGVAGPIERPSDEAVFAEDKRQPRHRKTLASADDTLDLGRQQVAEGESPREPAHEVQERGALKLVVVGKEMEVRLPLVASGLSVGREEDNDIILRSRLVSRHHLRILPIEGGAAVEDCGATNPAELRGIPLEGTRPMQPGDELRVCETVLTLAAPA